MIIDCFPFFNEFDLLEIRLNELSDIVDVFVLSEATLTFTSKTKPLYFQENKERFEPFLDRIKHVVIDTYDPNVNMAHPWPFEYYQKQRGFDLALELATPNSEDVILMSDLDEIPRAAMVEKALGNKSWTLARPSMSMFYYWFNNLCISRDWPGGKWLRPTSKNMSHKMTRRIKGNKLFRKAGWHFSYLTTEENIKYKIDSFSHAEFNKPPYNTIEHIKAKMVAGEDLFNRDYKYKYEFVEDLSYLPQYILDNMDRFGKYIKT